MAFGAHHIYRSLVFASLYGPPVPISRAQAATFNERIAAQLFPHATFKYNPPKEPRKLDFKVEIQEKDGKRGNLVVVDILHGALRCLVQQDYPESFTVAAEKADCVHKVFAPLACNTLAQVMEARVRVQVGTGTRSAQEFMAENVLGQRKGLVDDLGNVAFWGVKYEIAPAGVPSGPLEAPAREVTIEPLREERTSVYIEVMSKWGRTMGKADPEHPGTVQVASGPLGMEVLKPSDYFGEIRSYLTGTVFNFVRGGS